MATNLKTSKKIRAFIYRIIGIGAFLTFIVSAFLGRDAIKNFYYVGEATLSGEVYYLMEFREYVGFLYTQGMLYYAGVGDDNGYPLTDETAGNVSSQAYKNFKDMLRELEGDIRYYILTDNTELKNINYPLFSEQDGHLMLRKNSRLCCYWNGKSLSFFSGNEARFNFYRQKNSYGSHLYNPIADNTENIVFLLAIETDKDYTSEKMQEWEALAIQYRNMLYLIIGSGSLALLCGFCSLFSIDAGKRGKADYAAFVGKCMVELKLLFLFGIAALLYFYHTIWLCFPVGAFLYLFWTDLNLNGSNFWKNSIPVKLFYYIKEYSHSLPWQRKALNMYSTTIACALISILCGGLVLIFQKPIAVLLSVILILAGLLGLLIAIRIRRFVNDTRAIAGKISELEQGNPSTPLLVSKRSLLKELVSDINELENGIENAVEQRNRSNRMRVELITNVSHDLKTPLTSIINYADLLCEEALPEPSSDYAKALRQKAYRLKYMVQDVFDLSKATTGNLPLLMHRLDLAKLIRQTLADMDERIAESTLTFKLSVTEEPVFITADGDKLYRVFQNLFVNALQYSLDYSRVHIQLTTQDEYAVVKIKNTSKSELDFDTTEITERFVRADASRSTDGSGLGLSIVQSFTESCGGTFAIDTDADMFTACVRFPLSQEAPTCEPKEPDLTEESQDKN